MSKPYRIQLYNEDQGGRNVSTGGTMTVCIAGTEQKADLEDADGNALANPLSFTQGFVEFFLSSANSCNVYGLTSDGVSFHRSLTTGEDQVIRLDYNNPFQMLRIPIDIDNADTAASTEEDTGYDEPADVVFLPGAYFLVTTADSGITLDVGTDSTASGDADGFMDGFAVDATGPVIGTNTITTGVNEDFYASSTIGVFLQTLRPGSDVLHDIGSADIHQHVSTEKSITFTMLAGADTLSGLICLPYYRTVY